jgi:NAD(P)-dependent dehydrogenase (short-subunit alcohol dehydrogenase family)
MSFPSFTSTFHKTLYPRIDPSSLNSKGKTVFVTGGGQGIGQAIARAFITAGANVFIIGRSESTLRETALGLSDVVTSGGAAATAARIGYQVADVSNQAAVKSAFAAAVDKFGKIDVLISNAGNIGKIEPIATSNLLDSWNVYEVNVKGGLIVLQSFLEHAKSNATVINISTAATMGVFGTNSEYSSSKIAFVRTLDYLQVEKPELRVFSIHPGAINTEGAQIAVKKMPEFRPDDDISKYDDINGSCKVS